MVQSQRTELGLTASAPTPDKRKPQISPKMIKPAIVVLAAVVVFAGLVFWPAGRLDWVPGWLYVGLVAVFFLANVSYLQRVNPELIAARMRMGKGTKHWDFALAAVFGPILLSVYVVAGLDAVRFGWSSMSPLFWPIGLMIFIPGMTLFSWSMGVNPFFEKTVRIQTERGHRVIDTGPYSFVRHPGYLGFLGWYLSAPLLLGSWWSFVPAVASAVGLVIRTALEDRTLRNELAGYAAYSKRVRYRLIPGVW